MLRHASVQFGRWNRTYEPGEIVSGHIKFRLHTNKLVKSFYAQVIGQSKTSFPFGIVSCAGKEIYLEERIDFISAQGDDDTTLLKAGYHKYFFDFILPNDIPDTILRQWGKITYIVEFNLARPGPRVNKLFREFYVKKNVDGLLPPNSMVHLPYFNNFWFNGGQILGHMELTSTAYKVGTEIPVKLLVRNHSNLEVLKLICKLSKKMEYVASTPVTTVRYDKISLSTKHLNYKVHSGQHRSFKTRLPVPNYVDNLSECTIIKDQFAVELVIRILGFHSDICRSISVEIVP